MTFHAKQQLPGPDSPVQESPGRRMRFVRDARHDSNGSRSVLSLGLPATPLIHGL